MAVTLSCPHCQTQLKLNRPPRSNKTARCPKCKGIVPLATGHSPKPPAASSSEKEEGIFLAPAQQPDELGRLGPYRVLSRIGAGGMGMVFRAEDPTLRRQVALKVMLPQYASNPTRKARFLREAHAQARVEHEHIVAIFQAGEQDGVAFIAMPLLKGQTLGAALAQNPRPPLKEVLRIGWEMAEGLAAAHEAGLIHRDIKPSNVWLDGKRRRIKILDFGLARAADTTEFGESREESDSAVPGFDDGALTVQGKVVGTPLYMSPEQARGEKVDHRTDLFSLGIVLYQMTTGSNPFSGQDRLAILDLVKNHNPVAPSAINPDVPQAVSDLILRLLAKPVAERPASAEEVADALQTLESSLHSTENPVATPVLAPDDPWRDLDMTESSTADEPIEQTTKGKTTSQEKGRRRAFFIGVPVAGCVAAVVVVGVFWLFPKRPQPQPEPDEPVVAKGAPTTTKPSTVPKPDERPKTPATTIKDSTRPPFAWPAAALSEGRIALPEKGALKLLKTDEFDDITTGWPQGKSESNGLVSHHGYRNGTYFIRNEWDGGWARLSNKRLSGFSALVCQVEGRVVDDPAGYWELWFGNDRERKGITVKLNGNGRFRVIVCDYDKGDQSELHTGLHTSIKRGNEFNKLTLIYTADRLEVYVNGVAVCDPVPAPLRLQPVIVGLGLSGVKDTAEFRRLAVSSADGWPTPEERLKNDEFLVKETVKLPPFAWPADALRDGRILLPDLGKARLLKTDEFNDLTTGWPQGKAETKKGLSIIRGYQDGIYFIQKEYDGGWAYGGSGKFQGFSAIVCQVEGRIVDDPVANWDLWFGNDQLKKAVTVRLNGGGKFGVVLWDYDKGDQPALQSGTHAAIRKGDAFNKLTVIYTADRLEVFINGVAVCDPVPVPLRLQPVRLAFGVSGVKGKAEFKKLSIWSADGLPPPEERFKTGATPMK